MRRMSEGPAGIYAAVDLGTNNCRLLVAEPEAGGFRVVDSFSRIVRLGEGLGASGALSEAAMARTIEALRVCAAKMRRRGVTRARHVATEACRIAANGGEFLARVAAETGLAVEIIDPREEASLAVAGCAPLFDRAVPRALLFDIGGGSTEIAWLEIGRATAILDVVSLPFGVVNMAERHGGRAITRAGYDAIVAEIAGALAEFETRHDIAARVAAGEVQMVGTSGTVTTLAGIRMALARYDRSRVDGTYLELVDAWAIAERLLAMSHQERVAQPCILEARADFVVPGAAILGGICAPWPVRRLRVADRGLREGILLALMAGDGA